MTAHLSAAVLLCLATPATALGQGWSAGAAAGFAVVKPNDDAGRRPGSASASSLDLRLGHGLTPNLGAHLRLTGLLGRGHSGDYGLTVGAAVVEISARPWPLLTGPLVIRGGLGVGRARLSADGDVTGDARFQGRALGLALGAGVTYELGWPDGNPEATGRVWGPTIDLVRLPVGGGDARVTWISVGVGGTWYGG